MPHCQLVVGERQLGILFARRVAIVLTIMVVAVVQVGPVLMGMFARLVFVPVHMVFFCFAFVNVVVVAFIVVVAMLVGHRRMSMDMCVFIAEKNQKRNYDN